MKNKVISIVSSILLIGFGLFVVINDTKNNKSIVAGIIILILILNKKKLNNDKF